MTTLEESFATFGQPITIDQVADYVRAGRLVWSWGYGDDDWQFTIIELEDLWFIEESPADADVAWGPFRLAPPDGFETARAKVAD